MKENRALALKPLRYIHLFLFPRHFKAESLIITRLDVELALQTGLPPLFRSDALVCADCVPSDYRFTEDQLPIITTRLSRIMLSLASFAGVLNSRQREGRTKLDPLSYTETIVSLLYRLIEVAPLGQPRSVLGGLYDDVVHLTMLAFMTTLLPKYCSEDSSYLSDRLESAIHDLQLMPTDTKDSGLSLFLWILFIGGISVLKRKDHRQLVLETCEQLKLNDWPAIRCQLCLLPWIDTLHDAPGQNLWEDAQRRSDEKQ